MFTLGRGMFSEYMKKEEYFVLILGIDQAGKTTFADSFRANFDKTFIPRHPSKIVSTVGLNLVKVDCGHVVLNLWDIGGERSLRSLWHTYIDEASAIIFMIDASSEMRLAEALRSLCDLLKIERVTQLPLIILLNKCEQTSSTSNNCQDRENGYSNGMRPVGLDESEQNSSQRHVHDNEPRICDDAFVNVERHCSAVNSEAGSSSEAHANNEHSSNHMDAGDSSVVANASSFSSPAECSTPQNGDENSAEARAERIRSRIYECLDGSCEEVAIFSISALQNLNVHKSALWILNAIFERKSNG